MDGLLSSSPQLPILVSLPMALAMAVLLLLQIRAVGSTALRFIIFAIGFRLLAGVFWTFMFLKSPLGVSYNALMTLAIIALGLTVIRRAWLLHWSLLPVYFLMAIIVISGVINNEIGGMIGVIAKYGYFIVVMVGTVDACEEAGPDKLLRTLLLPLATPYVFQIASLLLGIAKSGESDGSASYIGGYYHEAVFSVSLLAGMVVLVFVRGMNPLIKTAALGWCTLAIVLANYRTAVIAFLPLLAITLYSGFIRLFPARQRGLATAAAILLVLAGGGASLSMMSERFADLGKVLSGETAIIKPPADFTREEAQVMSGRPYIWSMYVAGWEEGNTIKRLVGLGPDSWGDRFKVYAHNSLISALYDTGILGVIATVLMGGGMLSMALLTHSRDRIRIIVAHVSFLILGMATMPLWIIEGLILYALICGLALFSTLRRPARPAVADAGGEHSLSPAS